MHEWTTAGRPELEPPRQHINLQAPGAQDDALAWAYDVVAGFMGTEWLPSRLRDEYFLVGSADEDDPKTMAVRMGRILDLSMELNEAQHIRNFPEWIQGLLGRSLYQAVAELRGVNHAIRAAQDGWLIAASQSERRPEAITILSGQEVAIEVKSKALKSVADYKPNSIKSRLDAARGQLPPEGPAIVYLQIGTPWSENPAVCKSIYRTAERWLAVNRRANAVVLLIERYFLRGDGHYSRATSSVTVPSLDPRTPVPDLQGGWRGPRPA